ncbi:unnamed protein product [Mycena citricolor]|uniref:DDE-1 domain-containing protein n=1 Tax=Mycena citricolor TaxID=2018698 RepID=A0AAD2HXB5_9AGAR|nr:unnamed protein product [Mycena citricolor]
MGMMAASRTAALAHGFRAGWGSQLVRKWMQSWVRDCAMPQSKRCRHSKLKTIFDDPLVLDVMRTYIRSEKWSMNPAKLKCFMCGELDAEMAKKYHEQLMTDEMPRGLLKHIEEVVLPRLQLKCTGKGLLLDTMRIRPHILCAHNKMPAQAHDGKKASWIMDGEQPLIKKGPGQGHHRSKWINLVDGHMPEAGEGMDYGKNHEGWWNREKFVEQIKTKFLPAFKARHPDAVAVVLVDNSQGHAAYPPDVLRASQMNFHAGGKQLHMHDGWFMKDGQRVAQKMSFPADHSDHKLRGKPKGMQQVLKERGLCRQGLIMKCANQCDVDATDCCAWRILDLQPDFAEQKSLVQEIIENAGVLVPLPVAQGLIWSLTGHICIFLSIYHCEINFIEYFWGAVKWYLREHCDYTFATLKENIPKAMASVSVELIPKWEHCAWRFIEAYSEGLGAKDAQRKVKEFSSRKYKSHQRIPKQLAASLDA